MVFYSSGNRNDGKGAGPGGLNVPLGRGASDSTQYWKGFKFSATFHSKTGAHLAWVATCYTEGHCCKSGTYCVRKRALLKHGGAERTELLLKAWCMAGEACTNEPQLHEDIEDLSPHLLINGPGQRRPDGNTWGGPPQRVQRAQRSGHIENYHKGTLCSPPFWGSKHMSTG